MTKYPYRFMLGERYRFKGVLTRPSQELTYLGFVRKADDPYWFAAQFTRGDGQVIMFLVGSDQLLRLVPIDS